MSKVATARSVALDVLVSYETGGVWSQQRLTDAIRKGRLDRRDAAFCTHLASGTMQYKMLLDYHLSALSKMPLKRLETRVLCLLRMGAYQIIFSDGVHDGAAVSETVALAANPKTRGFANAILRNVTRIAAPLEPEIADRTQRLSIRWSTPLWLVHELMSTISDDALEAELAAMNTAPPVTVHVNTRRTSAAELREKLDTSGVEVKQGRLENTLDLRGMGDIEQMDAYRDGLLWVQDAAAVMAVRRLGMDDGDRVLDLCAAPGGKGFAAMTLAKNLRFTACDLTDKKVDIIRDGASRLGFDMEVLTNDARVFRPEWEGLFDKVICDMPCSGLGITRKKPDIKYKDPQSFGELPTLQWEILSTAVRYLKSGGRLLYSTCTWREQENAQVVERVLNSCTDVQVLGQPTTLWQGRDGVDGFFICLLEKKHV